MSKKVEKTDCGLALLTFFAGVFVGMTAMLLLSPMSGRETREKIKDVSSDVKERAQEVTSKVASTLREGTSALQRKVYSIRS
ncbi:YtxH domain-containing protein [Candidatus Poribacteria bacterium]|nr:YtxH domain-containing protein [Candidatus Poribacteria bacterium]